MFKWASWLAVAALALGVIAGALIGAYGGPGLKSGTEAFEAVGALWLNGLRMTVIPLVVSLLIVGVASVADAAATGRLAFRAIATFLAMLAIAAVYACVVNPLALAIWPVEPQAAAAFVAGAGAQPVPPANPPTFAEWLAALAPSNPIAAAADGAVLPLTVFALFFGFAATRLPSEQREPMVAFFRALSETMITIVRWVLLAAPLGVFALSLGVGLRSGLGAAGVLAHYLVQACLVTIGISIVAFVLALAWGRIAPARFTNALAPVLAVAFATQSSLASLPLMVERARDAMGVPQNSANLVLPLAVAVFRMTSPVTNLAVVFFVAAVHGMNLTLGAIVSGGFVAIAMSIGSVGLPGQVSFIASIAPICIAMGVPTDVLGILLAVEVIPDLFRTAGNVTGDLAVTAIVNRGAPKAAVASAPAAAS